MDSKTLQNPTESRLKKIGRRLGAVAICLLVFFAVGIALTFKYMSTYKASAVLLYQSEPFLLRSNNFLSPSLPTILDMITLPANLQSVKSSLGLDLTPDQLVGMIDVPPPREHSNLIRIYAKANNAALVVDIANSVAKQSVKNSREYHQQQLREELKKFEEQFIVAHERLTKELGEIEDFKRKNPYLQNNQEQSTISVQLQKSRQKVKDYTSLYQSLLVEHETLKREIATSGVTIKNSRHKERLQMDLMKLQGKAHSSYKIKQDSERDLEELERSLGNLTNEQIAFSKLNLQANITQDRIRALSGAIEATKHQLENPKGNIEIYQLADKGTPLLEGTLLGEIQRCLLWMGLDKPQKSK